jgi:predicted GNAT family acetyltransferase
VTEHVLDNPAWLALTSHHAHAAEGAGHARRYRREVSVFAAVDQPDEAGWSDLRELVGPAGVAVLLAPVAPPPAEGWQKVFAVQCHQMVLAEPPRTSTGPTDSRLLGDDDVTAMIELVKLTEPGPFRPRTIDLGSYLGVHDGDRLVAMAGERFHPPGFVEVSAVCTHPDVRGRGIAEALTAEVSRSIQGRGETPFLHVAVGNDNARRVYERLGFETRVMMEFAAFQAPG